MDPTKYNFNAQTLVSSATHKITITGKSFTGMGSDFSHTNPNHNLSPTPRFTDTHYLFRCSVAPGNVSSAGTTYPKSDVSSTSRLSQYNTQGITRDWFKKVVSLPGVQFLEECASSFDVLFCLFFYLMFSSLDGLKTRMSVIWRAI